MDEVADPYPGTYSCPDCGDRFVLMREREASFPEDWHFYVVHDHSDPVYPRWTGVLFPRSKGQRYPDSAKEVAEIQADQKKRTRQGKKAKSQATALCGTCGKLIILAELWDAVNNGRVYEHDCGRILAYPTERAA